MEENLRILLVDDDAVDRMTIRREFRHLGSQVRIREAVSIADAMQALTQGAFDCVLLDYHLPDGTGMDLLKAMSEEAVPKCAVILLTGLDDEELAVAALKEGAEDYLVKGTVNGSALRRSMRYAMERHETRQKLKHETKRLKRVSGELQAANEKLTVLTVTDALTGIANRRALEQRLAQMIAEARRGRKFSLVMADVDHFKEFNDKFGHPAGDDLLAALARNLNKFVREVDFVARYGGEEFCVLFTDVDEAQATGMTDRLRQRIAMLSNPHRPVTMSFGVAEHRPDRCAETLIQAADAALYRAKAAGRNCVVREGEGNGKA